MQDKELINISQATKGKYGVYSLEFHETQNYTHVKRVNSDGSETLFSVGGSGGGGTTYTAGTGIDINNGVISSTVVDTDTNNYISNVVLNGTDLVFTGVGSAANKTVPLATLGGGSAPENLVLRIEPGIVPVTGGSGQDVLFSPLGNSVKTNSLHVNPSDLNFVGAGEIEVVSDCIAKISLAAYVDTGNTNGQITFQIFEVVGGTSTPIGSASFELSNQAVSSIPISFTSYFDLIAGNIYMFSAYSTQNQMNIIPNSFIEFEIMK